MEIAGLAIQTMYKVVKFKVSYWNDYYDVQTRTIKLKKNKYGPSNKYRKGMKYFEFMFEKGLTANVISARYLKIEPMEWRETLFLRLGVLKVVDRKNCNMVGSLEPE